jgi:hypothetical protein
MEVNKQDEIIENLRKFFDKQNELNNDSPLFDVSKIISTAMVAIAKIDAISESNLVWQTAMSDTIKTDAERLRPLVERLGLNLLSEDKRIEIGIKRSRDDRIIVHYAFNKMKYKSYDLEVDEITGIHLYSGGITNRYIAIEDFIKSEIFVRDINFLYQKSLR